MDDEAFWNISKKESRCYNCNGKATGYFIDGLQFCWECFEHPKMKAL